MTSILSAQQGRGRGRINGEVKDATGNPLQGVLIKAKHLEYETTFTGKSDDKGKWSIAGLGTGMFRITMELEGYLPAFHDMKVSQFSKNNPPVVSTLQKIQGQQLGVPSLEDKASIALFEEGAQLYNEEKFQEAAQKFEEFLEKNPTVYRVNMNIGECYKELGEYEKALAVYEKVVESAKTDEGATEANKDAAAALAAIGETRIRMGDLDKANDYLMQAMEIFPDDETLAHNIGDILFKQGEAAKGIEYFDKAIAIKADWPPPYRQRGYAYLNLAEYKMALDSFKKFLELAPDSPQAPIIQNLIPELEKMIKK